MFHIQTKQEHLPFLAMFAATGDLRRHPNCLKLAILEKDIFDLEVTSSEPQKSTKGVK